ncbi:dihydrodipicolinate synthase family protein [Acuticoccus sp. MNP-M23]|uniref:dihydrodipicolinate synthase family protein n=1 Tax=Acuticoccus sp. MNP-M23 TaxID=3072793 RepID=UPI00281573E6|nr:dihydrodipicolinate synthase family protein [Acuticoccus sp. MNP-M23]WMS44135.1 dihydrodipicolinate synthase family protein [Acuticoccus sp. MNP-M23]
MTNAMHFTDIPAPVLTLLREGTVIPAHPLALSPAMGIDTKRQRALTRYYIDAGAGGLAVGVHTTQFEIREHGLYEDVLALASESADAWSDRPLVKVAGLVGRTRQAVAEAQIARSLGYHAGLMSLAAWKDASVDEMIDHCEVVAREMPLFGFYLQPAVGGIALPFEFWRRFAAIENVVGIKMAPFNRYATLDVVRGVAAARAEDRVTLYTGNDDHIVGDLIAPYAIARDGGFVTLRIRGGLLGHWSVWTEAAVALHARCRAASAESVVTADLLALDPQVTDCNAALFDVANGFKGAIAGCHEVLRRQGLLDAVRCLSPGERLSPGQADEISRVATTYPHLTDDEFVARNLERWLA